MKYQGSCHCGRIAFEAEGELGEVLDCNCSICQRKGWLLWFVPRAQVRLLTGADDAMGTYTFNKHAIRHRFCPDCGIHPFAEATAPDGREMVVINARCLGGVEPAALQIRPFDGRAL